MKKIGDTIIIKSALSPDGKFECVVNNISKGGYIHANPINPDGSLSSVELIVPVDSKEIVS